MAVQTKALDLERRVDRLESELELPRLVRFRVWTWLRPRRWLEGAT